MYILSFSTNWLVYAWISLLILCIKISYSRFVFKKARIPSALGNGDRADTAIILGYISER
jgi:hypothetical protein